ncbi:MAG: hypothetical protein KGJ82_11265 [Nitrospirota bacterium]|nr:hypothetical protein [Nitrospirota bacterium]
MSETVARWNETEWERAWEIVTRRLTGGPPDFPVSAEVQTLMVELDQAFLVGDVHAFGQTTMQLVHWAQEFSEESGVPPWWRVTH